MPSHFHEPGLLFFSLGDVIPCTIVITSCSLQKFGV